MASFLDKTEYPTYQDGQDAALRLTAVLWTVVLLALVALRATIATWNWAVIVPVGLLVFVTIGWCQASLSNGFHEAVHKNFGARHRDWLALLLLGYPTFFTLQYRTIHLQHHHKVGDPEEDPDFKTYHPFPSTRWELVTRLIFMGSGLAAAQQLLTRNLRSGASVTGRARTTEKRNLGRDLLGLAFVQLLILSLYLALFGLPWGPAFYVGFWILPLGMIAKLAKSTRAFCEHGSPERPFVLRTITGKPWQTGTLGMYGFHYHGEHHIYPWVPYARLAALHRRHLAEIERESAYREEIAGLYEHFEGGYFRLLTVWFVELPWKRPESISTSPQVRS